MSLRSKIAALHAKVDVWAACGMLERDQAEALHRAVGEFDHALKTRNRKALNKVVEKITRVVSSV